MFKVGDKVRCIDASGLGAIKKGNLYVIYESIGGRVTLKPGDYKYSATRFELISTPVQSKVDNSHTHAKGSTLVFGKLICKDCGAWL